MKRKKLLIIGAIIAVAAAVLIISCTEEAAEPPGTNPPTINSLEAGAGRVFPSESAQIVCDAADPDGDELTYEWWASGGEIDGQGAAATWTAPDVEGVYNIRVTVTDGRGGEAMDYVTIVVEANQPPIIMSLTAEPEWTFPSASLQVICDAEDPDGHPLSYEWSASGGQLDGEGPEVTWAAPQEVGAYTIIVVVDDGYGGSATRTLPVSVMSDQPPVIEKLEVTKDRYDHCYLREYAWGYKVGKEQKYDIECIVADTGVELSYEWSCEVGEILEVSEDGSMITWIAPDTYAYLSVTVTVTDVITASSASRGVDLEVVSCSPCTFGSCG